MSRQRRCWGSSPATASWLCSRRVKGAERGEGEGAARLLGFHACIGSGGERLLPEWHSEKGAGCDSGVRWILLNRRIYVPNSGDGLRRLTYRLTEWDPSLGNYMKEFEKSKPVFLTGDLNCAHQEIDTYNPAVRGGEVVSKKRGAAASSVSSRSKIPVMKIYKYAKEDRSPSRNPHSALRPHAI